MVIWNDLGAVKGKDVAAASLQAHYAAQWLGRFGRGLAPPQEDDGHTSFAWSVDYQAFLTDPAAAGDAAVRLGLRTSSLTLLLLEDDAIVDGFALHGRTDDEAGAWARGALARYGFGLAGFNAPAPYAMPKCPIGEGGAYEANKSIAALSELSRAYSNAQPLLEALYETYKDVRPGPSPVRTWPHHFDTGLIVTLEADAPFEKARAVGAGVAAPDKLYDEFYFYAYPWPRHPRKGLPKLKSAGKYQKDGFFGAVLPASALPKKGDQPAAVAAFLEEATGVFRSLVEAEMAAEG